MTTFHETKRKQIFNIRTCDTPEIVFKLFILITIFPFTYLGFTGKNITDFILNFQKIIMKFMELRDVIDRDWVKLSFFL